MVSLLGCAWDLLSDMAGEIVYADLKHLGDVSSAEKHRGKSYFGGKMLVSSFGKTFGFVYFWVCLLLHLHVEVSKTMENISVG